MTESPEGVDNEVYWPWVEWAAALHSSVDAGCSMDIARPAHAAAMAEIAQQTRESSRSRGRGHSQQQSEEKEEGRGGGEQGSQRMPVGGGGAPEANQHAPSKTQPCTIAQRWDQHFVEERVKT